MIDKCEEAPVAPSDKNKKLPEKTLREHCGFAVVMPFDRQILGLSVPVGAAPVVGGCVGVFDGAVVPVEDAAVPVPVADEVD